MSRTITLTFDNGPEPEVTPGILDVLARRGIKTTFFVLGHKLADPAARKCAERAAAEGHWIGNHTWSHQTPLGSMADAAKSVTEITRTQEEIGSLSHPDKLFRPFGGGGALGTHLLSKAAFDRLTEDGYSCVLWNCIPGDWSDEEGWPARAKQQIEGHKDNPLLVLHDVSGAASKHLDHFLGGLQDTGIGFAQSMPEACLIIKRGDAKPEADQYVMG